MFISALEQMRRYGVENADIRAAVAFARTLLAADGAVFPDTPCPMQAVRSGGPSGCAQYITAPDGGESYVVFVQLLNQRLEYAAAGLMGEHSHYADVPEATAKAIIVVAIAVHEVRHRLQEKRGESLTLWATLDLPPADARVVENILTELGPAAWTPRETDARIVEYLYVKDRLLNTDILLADAVCRIPNR